MAIAITVAGVYYAAIMAANKASEHSWEEYRDTELAGLIPILTEAGYALDKEQLHINGERYLMSGKKLVLTGIHVCDNIRVVIKASSQAAGIAEIERERNTRSLLHSLDFALKRFHTTTEVSYIQKNGYVISITEYISQSKGFLMFDTKEQFFLGLRALETQEGAHATTHGHDQAIRTTFGIVTIDEYLSSFQKFIDYARVGIPEHTKLGMTLEKAGQVLHDHKTTIERYNGFLTHTDFVPHNLRVEHNTLYLLDTTSIKFGNKYESWARFINYMTIHNPDLEDMLIAYVRENRGSDEYTALRLMRAYKIGFLLKYYVDAVNNSSGNLHELSSIRLDFWRNALEAVLNDTPLSRDVVRAYLNDLNRLRTDEERARQREISGKEKIEV